MVWTRVSKKIFIALSFMCVGSYAYAQESLWKTFNDAAEQVVPAYSGGLSPFPQKQKKVEELEFEKAAPVTEIEIIEADTGLSDQEKRLMLTTSILAEIKAFLSEEAVFVPNLDAVVVEAIAKANGKHKALVRGKWLSLGDEIVVPVDEARTALDLLDRLREVDEQLAETVENAVLDRTNGRGQEVVKIVHISKDQISLEDSTGQEYVVNFIKAPF